jgi:hypothetical protein
MPDQFVVPQFLDVEPKIIGPITGRQFAILLATLLAEFILYRLVLNIVALLLIGLPILGLGILFAFAKVNGQPFHYIMLNIIQTFRKPRLRVWDKIMTLAEIKARQVKEEAAPPPEPPKKKSLERSRLSELSLIANTGGVYTPEE